MRVSAAAHPGTIWIAFRVYAEVFDRQALGLRIDEAWKMQR
jgi:hypothetical protein